MKAKSRTINDTVCRYLPEIPMKNKLATVFIVLCLAGALKAQDGPVGLLVNNSDPLAQLAARAFPNRSKSCGIPALSRLPDSPLALAQSLAKRNNWNQPQGLRSLPYFTMGIDGTMDETFAITFADGVFITGLISNVPPGALVSVSAQGSKGFSYAGSVDSMYNYLILVPDQDTYAIEVCVTQSTGFTSSTSTYNVPPVVVNGDTSNDIPVASMTTYSVSGHLLNGDPRFPFKSISLASQDGMGGIDAFVFPDGGYGVMNLPDGETYKLTLNEAMISGKSTSLVLGTVTLNGTDVTQDFMAPATITISGTVFNADGTPPSNGTIRFFDVNTPPLVNGCVPLGTNSGSSAIDSSGNFQAFVGAGNTYTPTTLETLTPDPTSGFLFVQFDPISPPGDTTANFNEPALPGTVTFSGNVMDSGGTPQNGSNISAATMQITGVSNAIFATGRTTGPDGDFAFPVLMGMNYIMAAQPPPQQ